MGVTLLTIALIGIVLEIVTLIRLIKSMIRTCREIEQMNEKKGGKSDDGFIC